MSHYYVLTIATVMLACTDTNISTGRDSSSMIVRTVLLLLSNHSHPTWESSAVVGLSGNRSTHLLASKSYAGVWLEATTCVFHCSSYKRPQIRTICERSGWAWTIRICLYVFHTSWNELMTVIPLKRAFDTLQLDTLQRHDMTWSWPIKYTFSSPASRLRFW